MARWLTNTTYMPAYKQGALLGSVPCLTTIYGGMVMPSNFGYEKIIREKKEFRVGDTVEWEKPINKKWRILIAAQKREYGKGPFVVVKVRNTPRNKKSTRDLREAIGHYQRITVASVLDSNITARLSGAYFRIIRRRK